MAKKGDKKEKPEKPTAGTQEPETVISDNHYPDPEISGSDIVAAVVPKTVAEIETVADLEAVYPELVLEIKTGVTAPICQTVGSLEDTYPQLVSEIRDEVFETISTSTAKEAKKEMPALYQRIVIDIQSKGGPKLSGPGFLLEVDDPFAESTLRTYQKLKRIDGLRLPYVLPFKDKVTRAALESYILRSSGGGDNKRADAARGAMEKIK